MASPDGLDIDEFKVLLIARRDELQNLSEAAADARKPVALDQQSTGRLTRQDALQQQAMANAQEARRITTLKNINAALGRVEEGEFGWCESCGEAIARKRLLIDPTIQLCISCAKGGD